MTQPKLSDVYRRAKELIETKGWIQGALAMDGTSRCDVDSVKATCFCAVGALMRSSMEHGNIQFGVSIDEPMTEVCAETLTTYNDHPLRTKEEVLAKFDEAIVLLEERGQGCPRSTRTGLIRKRRFRPSSSPSRSSSTRVGCRVRSHSTSTGGTTRIP